MMNKREIKIAYIGGGSRQWARSLMSDLVMDEDLTGEVRLYDIDFQAAIRNAKIGNQLNETDGAKTTWSYLAYDDLEETLEGVDFVIISITPGTIEYEMSVDVNVPMKYGIYQSVGDTVGPGGYFRAMRMVPIYQQFAKAIKKKCPDAWVINYTNPMTLSVRTLYEVFPEIKAFGCCHEVFGTQELLMKALNETKGLNITDRSLIDVSVSGINHFTWIDKAYYKGIDLLPIYDAYSKKHKEGIYTEEEIKDPFFNTHKVKFDLYNRYHVIAAAGDRHLVEFLPDTYMRSLHDQEKWMYKLTPVSRRVEMLREKDLEAEEIISGNKELEIEISGEEGVKQIKAILGLDPFVTNINIPNRGQISWLPKGAIVETNAQLSNHIIQPLHAFDLPKKVQNLIVPHCLNQELFIESYFNQDFSGLFELFSNEPMMKRLNHEETVELFKSMRSELKAYLPDWIVNEVL